uniref:BMP binding endothelial regulator n=1 Tax=Oryzias melastigma TaxID=30732 RepID=A0A3B3BK14_ORYME
MDGKFGPLHRLHLPGLQFPVSSPIFNLICPLKCSADCLSQAGEVRCASPGCPELPCVHQVTDPGSCCPRCRGKRNGSSWFADSTPCMSCQCVDGVTTCSEVHCLSPCVNFLSVPGECCPVCADCVFEGRVYGPGDSFHPAGDPCQICTCEVQHLKNELSPTDFFFSVCVSDSMVSCSYQGATYRSYQQWEVDECTSCTCVSGDVHCRTERCPPLTCASVSCRFFCHSWEAIPVKQKHLVAPGLCCPHCIPRPATCITFGDPHYRTFDGRMFHFQGTCTYILTQDCESRDFSIHVTNDDRGRKGVSWTKEVTVATNPNCVTQHQHRTEGNICFSFTSPKKKRCFCNTLPLPLFPLKVLWSPRSHLEVSVPGSYKGHTCGLCGNFNNYHHDDLQMPGGQTDDSCRPGVDVNPCNGAGFQTKKGAITRCQVLKSAVFKPCHHVVPPEPWFGACRYDLCACGANSDECLCDTLEAYASQCRAAGVILQWRSASLSVGCPLERGFVFDECGPPCPVTCFNYDVPLGVIESPCFKPCVPGCQCPAGLILHNNSCIQPEKCPKIIHGSHL